MAERILKSMTKFEWGVAANMIRRHSLCFFQTRSGERVFNFIFDLTVGWGRYETVLFSVETAEAGVWNNLVQHPGAGLTRSRIFAGRKELLDMGVIQVEGKAVRMNVPGMLCALARTGLGESRYWSDNLRAAHRKSTEDFRRKEWPCEEVVMNGDVKTTIEEKLRDSLEQSSEAKQKKKARVLHMRSEQITPNQLLGLIEEYAREYGVSYGESTAPGILGGMLKTFLKVCAREGRDPRAWMLMVVKHWTTFHQRVETEVEGKKLVLPQVMSFAKYFRWRNEIDAYLLEEGDRLERDAKRYEEEAKDVEVIFIDDSGW